MNKPFSSRLGELFAHIQDLIDTGTHAVIKSVKNNGGGNRLLTFFSSLGDAYFRKYVEIKKDQKDEIISKKTK